MPRIRTVKPSFFRHEELFEAEKSSGLPLRVAYIGLWTCCDRKGRFEWKPRQLKLDILPWDELDFEAVLMALESAKFIESYEVDGRKYGWVLRFEEHQVINKREAMSALPPPVQTHARTCVHSGEKEVEEEKEYGREKEKEVEGEKEGDCLPARARARGTPPLESGDPRAAKLLGALKR